MVEFIGTPEAGKTTTISNLANKLKSMGYSVEILKESAEKLPKEIQKGIWDANLWMHYQTESGIIRAKYFQGDIVLIDRGLVDSKFYGKKFLEEQSITTEQFNEFCEQFTTTLLPDFVIALIVTPEIAVKRRGGEGHLVNKEYINRYNEMFLNYYQEIMIPKVLINTSFLDTYGMCKKVSDEIKKILP